MGSLEAITLSIGTSLEAITLLIEPPRVDLSAQFPPDEPRSPSVTFIDMVVSRLSCKSTRAHPL